MAECAAILSCAHVSLPRSWGNAAIPTFTRRKCLFFGKTYLRQRLVSPQAHVASDPFCIAFGRSPRPRRRSLRCCGLGAVIDPENIVSSGLVSYVDEALLVVSVIFAYMAGAIPQKMALPSTRIKDTDQNHASSSSIPYGFCGRSLESEMETKSNDYWNEVKGKLLDALNASERDNSFSSKAVESEIRSKICPLSLFALSEGSRLRLLSATLHQLQKEIGDIPLTQEVVDRDAWLRIASEVIKKSIQPACTKWLEVEASLEIEGADMSLLSKISEKLKENAIVLQNIDRSGKAELYADLLFFLRFGGLRSACCYDSKFLTQHGIDILEDVVIMLADGIASIFLELISVDSNMSTELNSMGLTICSLSTRELQRLRNEVVLNQWLLQNFESVVSMYEDRFELFVFCRQSHVEPPESQNGKSTWWRKFTLKGPATLPSLNYVAVSTLSLSVKRTKELRALSGWRYYFSLLLEFSDITMPMVKTIFSKVSNAVSFFLVYMIGRSLGLIFSGIRQSLGWR